MTPDSLAELFKDQFATAPQHPQALAQSGSDRRYYRLTSGNQTAIGTLSENTAENNTFFYFTDLLRKHKIRVPEVYARSRDRKAYLQEDLGSESLFDKLQKEGLTPEVKALYRKALQELAKFQWLAGREADFKQCCATAAFDEKAILSDLLYFKYYFLDLQRIPYNRQLLQDEMEGLARELGRYQPQMLMYRDFQSRNIMLLPKGEIAFIDYQGAMQGPPQYDLASLLWQAKAALPDAWKEELLNSYLEGVKELGIRIDEMHFRRGYGQFVLLRLLQVLGAYGFRGLLERKPHFVSSIAPALRNLHHFLDHNPQIPALPELRSVLERLTQEDIISRYTPAVVEASPQLQVTIQSFSYKVGLPEDANGHGGGFVFDCRGILNPGRFPDYKHRSGLDKEVVAFLETETRMPEFIEKSQELVGITVDDYLQRGFDHLSISFGCTGGQHRSVYASEKMAAWFRNRYSIDCVAVHHNRSRWVTEPV
ncbi:MAG: hypothetical protein EOP52_01335 [Sphingobacteriales bacterium]|nr:MAG: hypothetical protein EOP52_01335 [Sphingobacteriales bacterium]